MASKGHPPGLPSADGYHAKPSSVLRSFMHKRTASDGAALTSTPKAHKRPQLEDVAQTPNGLIQPMPLMELHQNQQSQSPSPKKAKGAKHTLGKDDGHKSLHKKTLSSISLKSLAGRDTEKTPKSKDKEGKPNKQKKTNLSNLLSRPKSLRSSRKEAAEQDAAHGVKDKENQNPNTSSKNDVSSQPPPIYAQFSSSYLASPAASGHSVEDEINLYTPREYYPSKQRDFYDSQAHIPTLNRRDAGPQRPKSTYLPSSFSLQDISRRISGSNPRTSSELTEKRAGGRKSSIDRERAPNQTDTVNNNRGQHGSNGKSKATPKSSTLDDKDVDREFEAMLDRRNIPEHQRGKMRSLTLLMKRDFIRQDCAETAAAKKGAPEANGSNSSAEATSLTPTLPEAKSKRPRSLTFTLSRGSSKDSTSPSKKLKPQGVLGLHSRTNSSESIPGKTNGTTSSGSPATLKQATKAKNQLSNDFVSYLRKVQKPELVEVGRLHKLRILLRNETVSWIEGFVEQGGMQEIVGLLHRIMAVEWREEHEDALLHEVLLCLKALSTTDLALRYIINTQETLFPALLHLIFDEEKKGPSEFTTRNIITSLLFTYLKSAPMSERESRSKILLTYLKDPEPAESQRPIEFVLDMRRSRPYQVWCKEVVNVTKEVFWIFLHNLNVIVVPGVAGKNSDPAQVHDTNNMTIASSVSDSTFDISNSHHIYMATHFPPELPPVPAAPYVGGVEWDATNYLASHLDIMNGILASLPTKEDRNQLREQLRISGWEKCMGGTLRLCKEKFYGCVHAALKCWVAAAAEDGWDTKDVRCGPSLDNQSPVRKNVKKPSAAGHIPKIEMKLDFGEGEKKAEPSDASWL